MFLCNGEKLFAAAGFSLTEEELRRFETVAKRLVETNKVMNLTAITEADEIVVKHFIDSLTCYDEAYFPQGARLLDLGTGAGFPGIPLAVMHGDLEITFFDSLRKRLQFLQELTAAIGYEKAVFLHGRAEEEAHKGEYREVFDVVTTRAVARLPVLTEWALPYVKEDGIFVALKGAAYKAELAESQKALQILGGTVVDVRMKQLPGLTDTRVVIYIKKISKSPCKYPRRPGIAIKNPL